MGENVGVSWIKSMDNPSQVELIKDGENSVRVDLSGGKIVELILDGKKILSGFNRIDGGKGETHPCSPNFGPVDNKYGLSQHGPARKSLWTRLENDNQDKLTMKHEIDPNAFPQFSDLVVEQSLYLKDDEFVIETTHTNNSDGKIPVNFGEHFYFNALFSGWERLTINGVKMVDIIRETGVINLKDENKISGLDIGDILLKQKGLKKAVLWTGRNEGSQLFDDDYVCIEPVEGDPVAGEDPGFFGTKESMLLPGDSRKTEIRLSLV